jgi:hypothetical protein
VFHIRNIFQRWAPRKLSLLNLFIRRDTPLKKIAIAVAVLLLAVSMVLPVVRSVNLSAGKSVRIDRTLTADGWPLPLPPQSVQTLVADGWPLPLPPQSVQTLVADGWPLPLPPQSVQTLVADGWPLPLPPQSV